MNIGAAIQKGTVSVSKDWTTYKKKRIGDAARAARYYDEMMRGRVRERSIKEIAYEVMERAYMKASGNGRYPAHARQIMYQARPLILAQTDKKLGKDFDQYFTQQLLPDYLKANRLKTSSWDVVFDARGHLWEPHTEREVPLGTLRVREYLGALRTYTQPGIETPKELSTDYPTHGPAHRYQNVLFIEKEGFMPLLEQTRIAERFDLAIMSTKGLANTSARLLMEGLEGVRFLVLHDFDKSGFSIAGTLQRDTRRYTFRNPPEIVDLGLRLKDVEAEGLDPEPVYYRERNPRANLRENGATKEEIDYLCDGEGEGQRVELNAFASDHFIEWLERKLAEHQVKKVLPEGSTLANAYQRAAYTHHINQRLKELHDQAKQFAEGTAVPENLRDQLAAHLEANPSDAWDTAITEIVSSALDSSER